MECKECGKKLRSDNSVGFCVKHRNLAPSIIAYKDQYYNSNKAQINEHNLATYYANKPIIEKRNCKHCDIEFQPTRVDNVFCTDSCGVVFWRDNNQEHLKTYFKNHYHTNINHKISTCLRSRLNKALKGNVKSQGTMALIGCSIDELRKHLESQFEPWMTWDNHGRYNPNKRTWHIDHVVAMAKFDLSDPKQQADACNYTNLKPLLAKNNLIKGNR